MPPKENPAIGTIAALATRHGVGVNLALAIATVETGLRHQFAAYDKAYYLFHEPEFYAHIFRIDLSTEVNFQKTKWGIMGISGGKARAVGFGGWLPDLSRSEVGAEWGIRKLKELGERYKKVSDVISAYDAGSANLNKDQKYRNHMYVDATLMWIDRYKQRGLI